jgi:hypothetical protein
MVACCIDKSPPSGDKSEIFSPLPRSEYISKTDTLNSLKLHLVTMSKSKKKRTSTFLRPL